MTPSQPACAGSAEGLQVEGGQRDVDYSYKDGVLTILSGKELVVSMANPSLGSTSDSIVVTNETAQVVLNSVTIDVSGNSKSALLVKSGSLDLSLRGESTLISGERYAGLESGDQSLSISGEGSLNAQGGNGPKGVGGGAGIGGGLMDSGSNITITGGKVTAKGGSGAAGIGGGYDGSGSNIAITGGKVTAEGGSGAAGIGGGYYRSGSGITIVGGEVAAKGGGDYIEAVGGAGIGGGYGATGSDIAISGGTVTAEGAVGGAGIGGGRGAAGSGIAITGGAATATGSSTRDSFRGAAGIGGGVGGIGSDIAISDGTVKAEGFGGAAGIGGGREAIGSGIAISGGFVEATPSRSANAIGDGAAATGGGEVPVVTGGSFADKGFDFQVNKVYGIEPAAGYRAVSNSDEFTNSAYPARVLPRSILETSSSMPDFTYGDEFHTSDLVSAVRGDEDATGDVTFDHRTTDAQKWTSGLPTDAGTYLVRATLSEGASQGGELYAASECEFDLVVRGRSLSSRVVGDAAKAYDGTTGVPADHTLAISLDGILNGDQVTASASSFAFEGASAGSRGVKAAGITLSGLDAANYELSEPTAIGVVASGIAKRSVSVSSVAVEDKTYDGSVDASVSSVVFGSLVGSEDLALGRDCTAIARFDSPEVGKGKRVTVEVALTGTPVASNYELPESTATKTVASDIAPAPFSYQVVGQEMRVGSHLSDIVIPSSATGVNGDAVRGVLSWYADASRLKPLVLDWEFAGEPGDKTILYWSFIPDSSETNYILEAASGQAEFSLVGKAPIPQPLPTPGSKESAKGDASSGGFAPGVGQSTLAPTGDWAGLSFLAMLACALLAAVTLVFTSARRSRW